MLAPATHHAFVGALVEDPGGWAQRFARLLGTVVTFERSDAALGPTRWPGVSLGDCTLALYRLPATAAEGLALWGRPSDAGPHPPVGVSASTI